MKTCSESTNMRLAISGLIGFCIMSIETTPATRISAKSISDYERDVLCRENISRVYSRYSCLLWHLIIRSLLPSTLRLCSHVALLLITVALQVWNNYFEWHPNQFHRRDEHKWSKWSMSSCPPRNVSLSLSLSVFFFISFLDFLARLQSLCSYRTHIILSYLVVARKMSLFFFNRCDLPWFFFT